MVMPGLLNQYRTKVSQNEASPDKNVKMGDTEPSDIIDQIDPTDETHLDSTDKFSTDTDYFTRMVSAVEREKEKQAERNKNDISFVSQLPDYPNGCEAACAVMLLIYHGYDITLSDFIFRYLPCDSIYIKDGMRYGPDPSLSFAGDPSDKNGGFGCFAPVISGSISEFFSQEEDIIHSAVDLSGRTIDELNSFLPCIIWVTTDYTEAEELIQWKSYDGIRTYTYPLRQHAVILKSGNLNGYMIIDPLKTEKEISITRDRLEACFDSMGRQAVTVIESSDER